MEGFLMRNKCRTQAYEQMLKNKYLLLHNQKFELGKLGPDLRELRNEISSNKKLIKKANADAAGSLYMWITINPNPKVKLSDFIRKVFKYFQRNMFSGSMFCFEQRGGNPQDIGTGFHVHGLIQRNLNYPPSQVHRNSKNTFKKMCSCTPQTLNIKFCPTAYAPDKMEYMLGSKTGEGKDVKQVQDKIWRDDISLYPFYISNTLISLLDQHTGQTITAENKPYMFTRDSQYDDFFVN